MCLIIKNGNYGGMNKSRKVDVMIKDNQVVMVGKSLNDERAKVIDASKIVTETIIDWFTS